MDFAGGDLFQQTWCLWSCQLPLALALMVVVVVMLLSKLEPAGVRVRGTRSYHSLRAARQLGDACAWIRQMARSGPARRHEGCSGETARATAWPRWGWECGPPWRCRGVAMARRWVAIRCGAVRWTGAGGLSAARPCFGQTGDFEWPRRRQSVYIVRYVHETLVCRHAVAAISEERGCMPCPSAEVCCCR